MFVCMGFIPKSFKWTKKFRFFFKKNVIYFEILNTNLILANPKSNL